jgi:hypothetical protein
MTEAGFGDQIAVGNYSLQAGSAHGAVANPLSPESPPARRPLIEEEAPLSPRLSAGKTFDPSTTRQAFAPLPDEEKRLLSALAAVGGGPLEAGLLAALADVADPLPALKVLLDQGLIEEHSQRYSLAGNLETVLPAIWDISPWCERALAYFLSWAEARREDPAALLADAGALRHLIAWAARTGRHAEVLRLGRILDAALMLSGRWSAWDEVLEHVRDAAAAAGDRAAEAWALHQLGTRLLCLGDKSAARHLLNHTLALRRSLGDREGAEVTRHNLGLLGTPSQRIGRYTVPYRYLPWLAAALLALIVGGVRLVSSGMGVQGPGRRQTAVSNGAPATALPPVSIREGSVPADVTSDLASDSTSDIEESASTTDLPAEADAEEPRLDIPKSVRFPTLTIGADSGSQGQRISLANTGKEPLRVAGLSFIENPGQAFTLRTDCTRSSISPGEQCSVLIFFHPPAAGSYRGILAVDTDSSGQRTVEVSGTAKEAPQATPREPPGMPPREPPEEPAPRSGQGWCCLDGEVYQSPQAACLDEDGTFFPRQRPAIAACLITGCCMDGEFQLGESKERCDERGGTFMAAIEVPRRCR